jgi:hypothetical protein
LKSVLRDQCNGNAEFGDGFLRTANFSPDGNPGYILDCRFARCAGDTSASGLCGGNHGCAVSFVVPDGHTYRDGGELYFHEYEVVRRAKGDVLIVAQHGSNCGRAGYLTCERTLFWTGRRFDSRN